MSVLGVIPARIDSKRLPGKMLLSETGKPLIQYAWEAANRANEIDEVIIATDSKEIEAAAQDFGAWVLLTGKHSSGTSRCCEVVRRVGDKVTMCVNIQGDEPEIDPRHLDYLVGVLRDHPEDGVATLAAPFERFEDIHYASTVKVVCDRNDRALYFSRSAIPDTKRVTFPLKPPLWRLHVGVYAFRKEFLAEYPSLAEGRLERQEGLEQLRFLEAGVSIRVGMVETGAVGIDTLDDYNKFVERQKGEDTRGRIDPAGNDDDRIRRGGA